MCPGLAYADKTTEERRGKVRCLIEEVRRGQKDWGMLGPQQGHGVMGTVVQGHRAMLKTVGTPGGRGELGGGNHRKLVVIKSEQKLEGKVKAWSCRAQGPGQTNLVCFVIIN